MPVCQHDRENTPYSLRQQSFLSYVASNRSAALWAREGLHQLRLHVYRSTVRWER
jgi:hypothetical protein